ncbi:class I SAM-dependent methyltransferase [Bacillus clarus]|uniref:Class I SAM-dependent methyltransferase n=1 Tax=Bacillus clarus TaxID=2338372 RepID=A0ABX9KTQ3_9BACI|nr:class I SAM-dependent methyltransferase [Bacillus clarus]RFT66066.1 class I SAM-dependent methyltransferase [Bacillus clarus]
MDQNVSNHNEELLPPPELVQYVGGNFCEVGEEFLRHFIEIGNLKRDEHVLDVGCGVGRIAVPLTTYLNKQGSYHGFDIFQQGISWCQTHISPKYNNFHFQHVNVHNQFYNPKGTISASQFRFPYEDETFDFVFLTSVFTHLLPEELEHYFSEVLRVMKNNGRCFVTFFLINPESIYYLNAGLSTLSFRHNLGDCYVVNKDMPEFAVSYAEEWVRNLFTKYNAHFVEPIHFGSWCGRTTFTSYQDIMILRKKNNKKDISPL